MKKTRIKICGLRTQEDIDLANETRPDYAGFIVNFPRSFRSLSPQEVGTLTGRLSPEIPAVGVFVNQPLDLPERMLKEGIITLAQLHGEEDPAYIRELQKRTGAKVIKAFKIHSPRDVEEAVKSPADYLLFDQGYGEGVPFDWSVVPPLSRPFFLAGGLGEENLEEAIVRLRPYGVDLSSRVETDRRKDPKKVRRVLALVRSLPFAP